MSGIDNRRDTYEFFLVENIAQHLFVIEDGFLVAFIVLIAVITLAGGIWILGHGCVLLSRLWIDMMSLLALYFARKSRSSQTWLELLS